MDRMQDLIDDRTLYIRTPLAERSLPQFLPSLGKVPYLVHWPIIVGRLILAEGAYRSWDDAQRLCTA